MRSADSEDYPATGSSDPDRFGNIGLATNIGPGFSLEKGFALSTCLGV